MILTSKVKNYIKQLNNLDKEQDSLSKLKSLYKLERVKNDKTFIEMFFKSKLSNNIKYIYDKSHITFIDLSTSNRICTFVLIGSNNPPNLRTDTKTSIRVTDIKLDLSNINKNQLQDLKRMVEIGKISKLFLNNKEKILKKLNKNYQIFLKKLKKQIIPKYRKNNKKGNYLESKILSIFEKQLYKLSKEKTLEINSTTTYLIQGTNRSIEYNKLRLLKTKLDKYIVELSNTDKNHNYILELNNKLEYFSLLNDFVLRGGKLFKFSDIMDYINEQNGEIL